MAEYQVEEIKDKTIKNGKSLYKIKWKGYDSDQCTWEPEANLASCREMLQKFNANLKKSQPEPTSKPKAPTAQKTTPKSIKSKEQPSKNKIKNKPYVDEPQDQYRAEDEEYSEEPKNISTMKRIATPLQGPSTRKNLKASTTGPSANASRMKMRMQNEQEEAEQAEMDGEQDEGQEVMLPRSAGSKLGEGEGAKMKILGMMKSKEGNYYFKVKQSNKIQILNRDEVVAKDPVALIVFYETNLRVLQTKS